MELCIITIIYLSKKLHSSSTYIATYVCMHILIYKHAYVHTYIHLKNFAWENQRENECYIAHIACTVLYCNIVLTRGVSRLEGRRRQGFLSEFRLVSEVFIVLYVMYHQAWHLRRLKWVSLTASFWIVLVIKFFKTVKAWPCSCYM